MKLFSKIAALLTRIKKWRRRRFINKHFGGNEGEYARWRWKNGLHPDE